MNQDKPYIDKLILRRARREAIKNNGRKALTEAIKEAKVRLNTTGEPSTKALTEAIKEALKEVKK
jgi:hypothetical protein